MQVTTDLVLETLAAVESTIRARFGRRLSRMNQRYDLDDLCQDVAIKAVNGVDGCRAETMEELRCWILTIAKFTCESQVTRHLGASKRSLRVETVVVGEATDESRDGYQPATGDCEGLDAAIVREEVEQAYAMLDRLWAPRKTALLMRLVDGASDEEIAEKLGVTQQTVRTMVSRGLAQIEAQRDQPSLF